MSVRVTNDPAEFAATVFPFLEKDPVLNTVLLSNVQDRATGVLAVPSPPVFVSVHAADGQVVGGCMRTPGRGIFLGGLTDALVPTVVDAFAAAAPEADVVEGTAAAARLFAEEWSSRFGKEYKQTRGTRLHKLGRLWLWELQGQPVCLVGHQATVFGSTRVGPVYTPSEHRGHGYASALTAFVSRRIIDSGSAACLYTDLANRTSNKIYAAIGYEPVADFVRYDFS
jgi:GNAT superfamily N-acetyltransferase